LDLHCYAVSTHPGSAYANPIFSGLVDGDKVSLKTIWCGKYLYELPP